MRPKLKTCEKVFQKPRIMLGYKGSIKDYKALERNQSAVLGIPGSLSHETGDQAMISDCSGKQENDREFIRMHE